jgi:ElaB/YqjD/DUF883 family membrane-anchored ribosome-binding protein
MSKVQGRTSKKSAKTSRKPAKKSKKSKLSKNNFLKNTRKKVDALKKSSSRTLTRAKNKVYATEKEIVKYVKENPVKSASSVALVALIAGFVSRFRK